MDKVRDITAKRKAKEDEQAAIDTKAEELVRQRAEFLATVKDTVGVCDQVLVLGYVGGRFRYLSSMAETNGAELTGHLFDALIKSHEFTDMMD